ncbi:MAG TPA: thiamine phosphate synthase [Hyphomicrobiaceae bacterium]|nr:thiamine phosphate synthase [Hyphomicrobiaceae bacterium]
MTQPQADCRIYLVVEADPAASQRLIAASKVAEIACCLIVPAAATALDAGAAKPLVAAAQQSGIAALIADDPDLARAVGADGVHLSAARKPDLNYAAARTTLGSRAIVGADVGVSRHDAMALAEAGADYIAFGAPSHLKDRVRARERRDDLIGWWGEIFEVACVALDVDEPAEAERLARAGADFVGVCLPAAQSAAAQSDLLTQIGAAIDAAVAAS